MSYQIPIFCQIWKTPQKIPCKTCRKLTQSDKKGQKAAPTTVIYVDIINLNPQVRLRRFLKIEGCKTIWFVIVHSTTPVRTQGEWSANTTNGDWSCYLLNLQRSSSSKKLFGKLIDKSCFREATGQNKSGELMLMKWCLWREVTDKMGMGWVSFWFRH